MLSSEDQKFSEIKKIKFKYKDESIKEIQNKVNEYILNNITPEEKKDITDYYYNISFATGIDCGMEILDKKHSNFCFKNIIQKLFIIHFDKSLELKNKLIDNSIKEFLYSLINIQNYTNNNILLEICLLMRNIIIKNNSRISKMLLKQVKLVNGNQLDENEISAILKINDDKEYIKNLLINENHHHLTMTTMKMMMILKK